MTANELGAFRALADPTRRQILMHLQDGEMSIGQVVDHFAMTRAAVKKHLTILERADLISVEVKGRERINHLRPGGLRAASDWINTFSRFWDDRLADLKSAIEQDKENSVTDTPITKTVFLDANRDTVWAFLTKKDKLAKWFHKADADLAEGRDYALLEAQADGTDDRLCWGRVLHMERPAMLVYSFTVKPLGGVMTTVTWTLKEAHGGTMLTLTHEGIGAAAGEAALRLLMALDAGWDEHLARLRKLAAA